jgi:hypothetical protein
MLLTISRMMVPQIGLNIDKSSKRQVRIIAVANVNLRDSQNWTARFHGSYSSPPGATNPG